jgi:AcrR family transcriptional regulator
LGGADARTNDTRRALLEAAIETLRVDGFAGASARAIAKRAECNQALVFYYFGSVADLLLAALDEVSQRRLDEYSAAVEGITRPADLAGTAAKIFEEDLDKGYLTVLAELIAGASAVPGLGAAVAARIGPWKTFASNAIDAAVAGSPLASVVPVPQLAHAVVALYLGLEMLAHLDGDREPARALFSEISRGALLLEMLTSGYESTGDGQ